jgi:hypothetical protein
MNLTRFVVLHSGRGLASVETTKPNPRREAVPKFSPKERGHPMPPTASKSTLSDSSPATEETSRPMPPGWVDHPKIPITRRAVLAGIAIMILGVIGAVASIYARRTRLELTTEFWGPDAILAMQVSPKVTLQLEPIGAPSGEVAKEIDLTGTPGLGHLRHALLDQRHYDWPTRTESSVESLRSESTRRATLMFSDPLDKFPTAIIELELIEGWVGPPADEGSSSGQRVRLITRAQPAVRHFLTVISNAKQNHYDNRKAAEQ